MGLENISIITEISSIDDILKNYLSNHISDRPSASIFGESSFILTPPEDYLIAFSIAESRENQDVELAINCKTRQACEELYKDFSVYKMTPCLSLGVTALGHLYNIKSQETIINIYKDFISSIEDIEFKQSLSYKFFEKNLNGHDHLTTDNYARLFIESNLYKLYFDIIFSEREGLIIIKVADDNRISRQLGEKEASKEFINSKLHNLIKSVGSYITSYIDV